MNIEDIFNLGVGQTSPAKSSVANGRPPCQNIMFPNSHQFFSSSQQQNPYQYQPLIHVPTRSTTSTLGETGASVDMLRAQLTELSKRMDTMESRFSKFEKSVSNDIFLLKSTLSEHATELLNIRDTTENTHAHVKKTNDLIKQQDICIDKLADMISRSGVKTVASKIDLGIIRRRLSKIEDFTSEFYEQFESFKNIKDIFSSLSNHIDECDKDISSFIMRTSYNLEFQSKDDGQNISNNINNNNLETYFSNYEEGVNGDDNGHHGDGDKGDNKEVNNYDDDFEKL